MKKLYEFETLEEAQTQTEPSNKMISGDQMRVFMIQTGLYGYFKNHTSDAQMAAYDNTFGGEFNFINEHPSNLTSLFQYMVAEEETPDVDNQLLSLLSLCQTYANQVSYPYSDVTQEEFNACKDAYSEEFNIELDWNNQRFLKLTLHDNLYEPKSVSLFFTDLVYTTPENLGTPKRLSDAGEYVIDMLGVQKTGKLIIKLPIKANITCELI